MNRVYKVIWSKAKHCYVVTSEIARSVTKSASSARSAGRKGAAVLAMAALLFTAGGVLGEAANVTDVKPGSTADVIMVTIDNVNETPITINNVAHAKEADYATAATKAYSDGEGHVIVNTYVKNDDAKVGDEVTYVNAANTVGQNLSALDTHVKANADAVGQETADRKLADQNNLKVGDDGVISKVSNDGTTPSAVKTLVLNKEGKNQITLSEDGIKVGTNSTVIASDGVFAGGDKADAAKAALNADGSIKGAGGKFAVGTDGSLTGADGKFAVNADGKVTAKGGVDTDGDGIQTRGGIINAGAGAISGGAITGTSLNTQNGEINGGDIKSSGTIYANGKITGNGLDAGSGAINGGSLSVTGAMEGNSLKLNGGNLDAGGGTITTTGTITTKDLEVKGGLKTDHMTLGSKPLNYTDINGGNVTSVNSKVDTGDGRTYTSSSELTEKGRTDTAANGTTRNVSTQTASESGSTISSLADEKQKSYITQNLENIQQGIQNGDNATTVNQTATDIKNTAEKGMISNTAKNLVNKASENMTNTVGKDLTTTVGGDSSLTAENITNEAKNRITNKALDVETDASSSIVNKVANDAGSNTSTQWSYQTKEEMSQTDGKTASYFRGAVEEKSQLIDGDKKTTIDTIAGQTNTNITEGKNVSNSLQKADQIASSVTDGTNTTVVNQDARSLASSITDGTRVNNTISTVDTSVQRIQTDDTHYSVSSKSASKMEDALISGSTVIDSLKDAEKGLVSTAVTDGRNRTGSTMTAEGITNSAAESIVNEIGDGSKVKSEMTAKGITNTAKDGTITNDAKDVFNKGTNSVINEVGNNQVAVTTDSVKAAYGSDTSTTWDAKGITSATSGDMKNSAKNISNSAAEKLSNSAAEIENTATKSITDKVGKNTSWKMTDGTVVESVKDESGKTNQTTTTAADTYQFVKNGDNTLAKRTSSTNDNLNITDGTNTYTKITTATGNKQTVTDGTETASTNLTKSASNTLIENGTQSVLDHMAADTSYTVMNEKGNGSRRQQTASEILDRVTDGTDTSEVKQTASEVAISSKNITNTADTIKDVAGKTTVITTDSGTTFENTDKKDKVTFMGKEKSVDTKETTISGNTITTGEAIMDYANVTKDLSVEGDATVDKDLTVKGTSEFVGRADFRNDVYVDENLTVAKETRTDTLYVDHDGYVGGNLNVDGNIETHDAVLSADSRQVVTGRQLYQTNERVDRLDNRIKKVGANAAALAALRPGDFNPDDKFSIAAGFGSYRNASAAALGLFYRPNENVILSLGTSFGDGENMVNAGVSVKFGRGKSMAERRKEMADEVSGMRDEMKSQNDRIAELEEMLKKQSELIEKLSKES